MLKTSTLPDGIRNFGLLTYVRTAAVKGTEVVVFGLIRRFSLCFSKERKIKFSNGVPLME